MTQSNEKMQNKFAITIISIAIFLIIILTIILILNSMEDRFMSDCEKQNYQGIKSYWDLDIDCSQIHNIPNLKIINNSVGELHK